MDYEIVELAEFEKDIFLTFDYYFNLQPDLIIGLRLDIDDTIGRIGNSPFHFSRVYRHYRRALLEVFLCKIFFRLDDTRIVLTSLFHNKRSKRFIKKQLRLRTTK